MHAVFLDVPTVSIEGQSNVTVRRARTSGFWAGLWATGTNGPGAFACFEGRGEGWLWAMAIRDGGRLSVLPLEAPPVWDGIAVANGRVYISKLNGVIECLSGK